MSRLATADALGLRREEFSGRQLFAAGMLFLAATAAFLAGWAPLGFSIVTVFLFAGPHNWIEIRYFMARMPARWGPLRNYFLFSFGGILALTAAQIAVWTARDSDWYGDNYLTANALWNSMLLIWLAVLIQMRSRQ